VLSFLTFVIYLLLAVVMAVSVAPYILRMSDPRVLLFSSIIAAIGIISALVAIHFLVDACALAGERKINGITTKSFDERCEWVIDLFERLSTPGRQV
jgi:hypothetical protein